MDNNPDFLPPILELSGSWEDILSLLYSVFNRDFKAHQTRHQGIPVYYDRRILPDGYGKEEGFWHVVSRLDYTTGDRLIDYRRAERLPWARPLMESPQRPEIKVFDYEQGPKDKGVRTYIWLENYEYDYVLILQRRKGIFLWITAFCAYRRRERGSLRRKYEEWCQ